MFVSGASQNRNSRYREAVREGFNRLPSPVDTPERTMGVSSYPTFPALALFRHVEKKAFCRRLGGRAKKTKSKKGKECGH